MQAIRTTAAAALSLALFACGGGGSPSSPSTTTATTTTTAAGGTASATGIYDVGYGQFRGIYALLDDGRFYGAHFVGNDVLAGHPYGKLSSANSINNKEPIAWANFIDDVEQVGRMESDPRFGRSASQGKLEVAISSGMGNFSATVTDAKTWGDGSGKTLYKDAIPLATLAGNYGAFMRSVGISEPRTPASAFVIDAAGNASATVGNCNFTGRISQYGATGVYELQWSISGAGCKFAAPQTGIVMPISMSGGKPVLIFMSHNADSSQTAVFRATHS